MSARQRFYGWQGPRPQAQVGDAAFRLPFFYHDNDVFMTVHPASYEAVAAELPTQVVEPVRWVDGRALVAVTAFRYHVITWSASDGSTGRLTPYGEISVAAVVNVGPAPRALPLLRRRLSGFVLHLPVTTMEARDGGRELWGFPKFVADMDFVEDGLSRRVELAEGGSTIFGLTVRPVGPVLPDRRPLVAYTVLNGDLLETVVPVLGHAQVRVGAGGGALALGSHPVAERLRQLEISAKPVIEFSYLDHRSILPAGTPIGPARGYEGYRGVDRRFGRFTVAYPETAPLDQYATLASVT